MNKIIGYFYIFSKLTTSFVLISIIILMGYVIFRSYDKVDKESYDLESTILSLRNIIENNSLNLSIIENKLNSSENTIKEIKKVLIQNKENKINNNYKKDIENLLSLNKELQEQVNQISLKLKNNSNVELDKKQSIQFEQINSLIDLIIIKYNNGENISQEISILNKLSIPSKDNIFDKLALIELKKFNGLKHLNISFNQSAEKFIKKEFLNKNQIFYINFLSKFIDIKPNNLSVYEDEKLNILMRAKNYMLEQEFKKSLDQILLIDKDKIFFSTWIDQVNIYLEFKSTIEKVN